MKKILNISTSAVICFFIMAGAFGSSALADENTSSTVTDTNIQAQAATSSAPDADTASSTPEVPDTTTINAPAATSTAPTETSSTIADVSDPTPTASDPATSVDGNGLILTGNANAAIDVTNVIDANLVNSNGIVSLMNLFAPQVGNIDLSSLQPGSCSNGTCNTTTLALTNNNSSTLNNTLSAVADSGDNTLAGVGCGAIATGDANAAANVVNVDNANLVNSNYLLLVFNNFSSMSGDLVLPPGSFFGSGDAAASNPASDPAITADTNIAANSAVNTNIADNNITAIANNNTSTAQTGENGITNTGDGDATVATGQSNSASNVVNAANTNDIGTGPSADEPVFVLVRIFGTWNGQVFSTPSGLYWQQTPDGLLLSGPAAAQLLNGSNAGAASGNGTTSLAATADGDNTNIAANQTSNLDIANSNNANLTNNVQAYALTGNNNIAATGNCPSLIATGNANAITNTINLVNTNIVGQNMLLAIINIFGNWNGNLAFGQPDLWVGADANVSDNPLQSGSTLDYQVTVKNLGDTDATGVVVKTADPKTGMTAVTDPGNGTLGNDNSLTWNIPDLAPGASQVFNYQETMGAQTSQTSGQFTENISAEEHEDDADPTDNTETVSFPTGWINYGGNAHAANLQLTAADDATSTIPSGSTVHYNITAGDTIQGGIAHNTVLKDVLQDPYGNVLTTKIWPIGTINPGDKLDMNYDAQFPQNATSGYYIDTVSLQGWNVDGTPTWLKTASTSVYVVNPADYPADSPPPTVLVPPPEPGPSSLAAPLSSPPITMSTPIFTPPLPDAPSSLQSSPSPSLSPVPAAPVAPPSSVSADNLALVHPLTINDYLMNTARADAVPSPAPQVSITASPLTALASLAAATGQFFQSLFSGAGHLLAAAFILK